ncbi:MAG: PepSY domain-containing protein [Acidobacteriota bacterium]
MPAAPMDLGGAVKSALAMTPGTAVSVKKKDKKGVATGFEVEVLAANGTVMEIEFGPDGRVIPGGKAKTDPKIAAAATVTKITIDQAIAAALRSAPGTATEAKLSHSKNLATWEVEILTATGQEAKIKIDAGTGQVVLY